jgi:hypothetical protein
MLSRKARATAALRARGPNPDISDQPTGRSLAVPDTTDRLNAGKPGFDARGWALDPRTMAREQLDALGHRPISPLQAIRSRCLDCSSGSIHEVRLCASTSCPSWPFRLGRSPWRAPTSEAQRAHLRQAAAKAPEGQKYGPSAATARGAARIPSASAIALALENAAGKVVS